MTRIISSVARLATAALLPLVMVACGGGSADTSPAPQADAAQTLTLGSSPLPAKTVQGITTNVEAQATTLTVRAHGVLAGNVGPMLSVAIDGAVIDTIEVRATAPTDYRFAVPPMQPGSKVDIVYSNDASVDGVDRNLFITQIMAGATYVLPTSPGVTVDWGTGAAAFDGQRVVAGQGPLWSNGALRVIWPAANMTDRLTVRASGTLAEGVGPRMDVVVNGVVVATTEVRASTASDYTFAVPPLKPGSRVDLAVTNAGTVNNVVRALNVAYLKAGSTVLLPTSSNASFDQGSGAAAFDGINVLPGQSSLATNGALRGRWPAVNMTHSLTVRASGRPAGGVNPLMQVQLDGVVLGTVEVQATTLTDHTFAALPIRPGSQLQVDFLNEGTVGVQTRALNLAYAMSGATYLAAINNSLRGTWPSPNLTDTLTVRAKGTLADGVGPTMDVLVDGIKVGSMEVRAASYTDYSFASPAMQPGRRVEVVHAGAAAADASSRKLHVAYLVSGPTFVRASPNGNGEAQVGSALAIDWTAPNITESVTVRAGLVGAASTPVTMQLWVDGVAVSTAIVRSTTPTDHVMATPSLRPGAKIAITVLDAVASNASTLLKLSYLVNGSTVLRASDAGFTSDASGLQASWPAANLTSNVTVRAHGTLAGDVGPIIQLMVDGAVVDTAEVRSSQPADHALKAPVLTPGAKVDIVYINDATVNGVDRNLFVTQVTSGSTYVLPTTPGVSVDWGSGIAAFDGISTVAGQGALWANGALRAVWPAPNLTDRLTVRASGTPAGGVAPVLDVMVDNVFAGSVEVRAEVPTDHAVAVPSLKPGSRIDIAYRNAGTVNGIERGLRVAYLMAPNTVLVPSATTMVWDQGTGLAAFDGLDVQVTPPMLTTNGALRGRWPAANMTDTLTVRASGRLAGGQAPVMQVLVDGVVLGSAEVSGATPTDFTFPTLPMKAGSTVQTVFTNPGTVGNETRGLTVAYAMAGRTYLLAANGGLNAAWPEPNLTDTLTVRARGSVAGNQGPIMQVLVDGVMVGNTEVRSATFADFSFPAPAMQPGRKVEVVYTNDATVGGVDRNLFITYLIAGSTYQLPAATGTVYDRGFGRAAFDGLDTFAGHGFMYWNGALRMTWPAANITDTLTVRAQGSLAGNVGPVMQVWVDGVAVSSAEVRSTTAADYRMPVPPLRVGSRIDIAYTNDGVVDGVDRNLTVFYAMAGNTFVQPATAAVRYDLGLGNAAFDGQDTLPGQTVMGLNGALRFAWPSANIIDTVHVRASASLAENVGGLMQLRVDGVIMGTQEVRSTSPADYFFAAPRLQAGSRIDVVFVNDLKATNGEDRNLYVQYLKVQGRTLVPTANGVVLDSGSGEAAVDGAGTEAGSSALYSNGALRWVVPAPRPASSNQAAQYAAARLLLQGGFGGRTSEIERVAAMGRSAWIDEQLARRASPDFVNAVQARYDLGNAYRPFGTSYTPTWVAQRFWQSAATAPDALRKRMMFALHQMLMVSQADSSLYDHARAYAAYLDILNANAFGNFRVLLEEVALSPAMGIYLSHMRNRPEDLVVGRMPDENFAREIMQLFTIGLHELNLDGTPRLDAQGNPIETYTNDDVMAMAKVFTGYGWAFPDSQLTESRLRWGGPDYSAAGDTRIDLLRMKAYPGMHSLSEKRLFKDKGHALVIPAGTGAADSLRLALDTLFNHPNVAPFVSRQLIQRLVTSHPSPAYVARVATVFNNNGRGVRGDLGAVVRAILMDTEAINPPVGSIGKLREPVLRVANWMRAFDATSVSGEWLVVSSLDGLGQKALHAPSVFGYFRPGYVPPNTGFATTGTTVPEMQIVNEATTAQWVNTAMGLASDGIGWTGAANDVRASIQVLADMAAQGDVDGLIERLNLLLYAGRMSANLKNELLQAISSVAGNTAESQLNRARVALFLALASAEYMVQP